MEGDRRKHRRVLAQFVLQRARFRAPGLDGLIEAPTQQQRPVRREGDAVDDSAMLVQGEQEMTTCVPVPEVVRTTDCHNDGEHLTLFRLEQSHCSFPLELGS